MVLLYYYVYFFVFHAIRFQVTVYCICGNFLQPILILIIAPHGHCLLGPGTTDGTSLIASCISSFMFIH